MRQVRGGRVSQTMCNYTGQPLDDTELLFYHARYYDPVLARFTSAAGLVPGAASSLGGAVGGEGV
jgi:RHS repeat-associated protein